MALDLSQFTPQDLAALRAMLQAPQDGLDPTGRSPIKPRQLSDLRLMPKADDPRPLFIPSAEAPREWNTTATFPYPRLLWSPAGEEITVHDAGAHRAKVEQGYLEQAPSAVVVNPMTDLADAIALLSPEEQALILDAQQQDRLKALQAKLAALSPEALEQVTAALETPAKRKKKATAA